MKEYKGHYIGPIEHLAGEPAILHLGNNMLAAQFDNHDAEHNGVKLAYGWHRFPREDWQVDYEIGFEPPQDDDFHDPHSRFKGLGLSGRH